MIKPRKIIIPFLCCVLALCALVFVGTFGVFADMIGSVSFPATSQDDVSEQESENPSIPDVSEPDESVPDVSEPEESLPEESDDRPVTVKVVQADGGTITVSDKHAAIGDTVTVGAVPIEGWTLAAILRDGILCPESFEMDTAETVITAVFMRIPDESDVSEPIPEGSHAITVIAAEHGTVTVELKYAANGDRVDVTAKADEGYELNQIVVNGAGLSRKYFLMPDIPVTVTATFKKIKEVSTVETYKVTANYTGEGEVIISRETAPEGTPIVVSVIPADRWKIVSLTFNGISQTPSGERYTFDMPALDVEIDVVFGQDNGESDESTEISEAESEESEESGQESSVAAESEEIHISVDGSKAPEEKDGSPSAFYYFLPFIVLAGISAMLLIKRRI